VIVAGQAPGAQVLGVATIPEGFEPPLSSGFNNNSQKGHTKVMSDNGTVNY
jgi:hypothetical protein